MPKEKEKENQERCSKRTLGVGVSTKNTGNSIIGLGIVFLILFAFFKYYAVMPISDWTFIGLTIIIASALVISIVGKSILGVCNPSTVGEIMDMMKGSFD